MIMSSIECKVQRGFTCAAKYLHEGHPIGQTVV